jgi:hypothetical protein
VIVGFRSLHSQNCLVIIESDSRGSESITIIMLLFNSIMMLDPFLFVIAPLVIPFPLCGSWHSAMKYPIPFELSLFNLLAQYILDRFNYFLRNWQIDLFL